MCWRELSGVGALLGGGVSQICWGTTPSKIIFAHGGVVGGGVPLLDLPENALEVVKGLLLGLFFDGAVDMFLHGEGCTMIRRRVSWESTW